MKSFLSGRSHAHAESLQAPVSASNPGFAAKAIAGTRAPHAHAADPHVECVKQGDKITRLIVTCSCGERIEIECLYPVGG
jgi:hypothetical protein